MKKSETEQNGKKVVTQKAILIYAGRLLMRWGFSSLHEKYLIT